MENKQLEFALLDFLFKENVVELYQTLNDTAKTLDSYLGIDNINNIPHLP
jgi:hypothetical protein